MFEHFVQAQDVSYECVLSELQKGRKRSHWIWYIFPQIAGLGHSPMAEKFALHSLEQAVDYYQHKVLGRRLMECVQLMLRIEGKTLAQILPYPDDLKFISSMTLFHLANKEQVLFSQALQKYHQGQLDEKTLRFLIGPKCD